MSHFSFTLPSPGVSTFGADTTEAQRIGSGLTDAQHDEVDHLGDPLASAQQTQHAAKALSRLIKYLRTDKPRIAAFLAAFTAQIQSIEDVLWSYYSESRDLDFVAGVLLDRMGALVDEARNGRTDAQYRAAIRVKVLVVSSDGKLEQLFNILTTMIPGVTIGATEIYPAHIQLAIDDLNGLTLAYIKSLLVKAKAGGVSIDLGFAGGNIGDTDGTPAGAAIGDTDGTPAGGAIGLAI